MKGQKANLIAHTLLVGIERLLSTSNRFTRQQNPADCSLADLTL
jgi:hypothetical protein